MRREAEEKAKREAEEKAKRAAEEKLKRVQVMYQAPGLATVLKNKYIPSCMVHRRRIRKKIPNCLPAEASN